MKSITLPNPPDPTTSNTWQDYAQKLTTYLSTIKGKLEDNSRVNNTPAIQGVVLGTYTKITQMDDTLSGTDLANAICTLLQALQNRGITTPSTRS